MNDIFWGGAIIVVGVFVGGSIFLGDFSVTNFIFDGIGLALIGKGIFTLLGESSA